MHRAVMPDLETAKTKGFVIPGGWILTFGEYSVDREREDEWTAKLMATHKHDPMKARKDAKMRADKLGRREEYKMLVRFVRTMACLYAKKFPEMIEKDRTLRGYDPAFVASIYIPYRERPGRDGSQEIRQVLEAMAVKARRIAQDSDGAKAA